MGLDLNFDALLESLGSSGRYQICQYIWLLLSLFAASFGILGYIFIGKPVPHQCTPLSPQSFNDILTSLGIPPGDVVSSSTVLNDCTIDVTVITTTTTQSTTVDCLDGQDFGPPPFTSVVSDFNLVCERKLLSRLPQFFFVVAQALGGIIIPLVADRVGRRPLLITSHAAVLIFTISMAFPRSVEFFTVLKAISGVFVEGLFLVAVTMTVELTSVKDRKLVALVLQLGWFTAGLALVAIAFGLRLESWRILQYVLAASSIVLFFQIYIIEESIRWLLAVGLEKQAIAGIEFAASTNNVDVGEVLHIGHGTTASASSDVTTSAGAATGTVGSLSEESTATTTTPVAARSTTRLASAEEELSHPPCCQLGSNRHLLSNTFIFIYIWFVTGFAYYALYFTTTVFANDVYLSFTVNVLSELPAALIIVFGIDSLGRKKTLYIFLTIAVVFLTTTSLITAFTVPGERKILLPIFGLLGKLGVAGTYFALLLYTGETYPTSFRLLGLGVASVSGRVGALGAPFLIFVGEDFAWIPTTLISCLLLIAIFAIFPLPETKGRELPQTLEDVDNLYRN